MKEKIIEVLRKHPNGLRMRDIAMYLYCNRSALINELDELKKAGLIDNRPNEDHTNCEYYNIWFLVE